MDVEASLELRQMLHHDAFGSYLDFVSHFDFRRILFKANEEEKKKDSVSSAS